MKPKPIISAHRATFRLATVLCAAMLSSALPGRAQFTGDYQTNIIDGRRELAGGL